MDRSARETEPYFSKPVRQIALMLVVVALALAGVYLGYATVASIVLANVYLNGFIGLVFLIGVVACFLQVLELGSSVTWIEDFAADTPGHEITRAPRLLAPLAALLRSRGKRMQISASSSQSILESVATRLDEARDITRYLTNLLIFLGLLGTFYGLATTVPAVVETIRSLAPQQGETGLTVFDRLMTGLEKQLGGMGTAFSSSLLGLAGSLVVGLLELFAGHGQNRFYRELEEWLSSITRIGFATADPETGSTDQGLLAAVLDQLTDQMDGLQRIQAAADARRTTTDAKLAGLADAMDRLARRLEAETGQAAWLAQIADGQEKVVEALAGRGLADGGGGSGDPESRMRLRSIDVQLLRILEELSAGRSETTADLRGDIAGLTSAIRQLSRGPVASVARRD